MRMVWNEILVTRWEHRPENFLGPWRLAAMLILVKHVL
jgi:hypothetical protein